MFKGEFLFFQLIQVEFFFFLRFLFFFTISVAAAAIQLADGYVYREWLPNAKQVFLIGESGGLIFQVIWDHPLVEERPFFGEPVGNNGQLVSSFWLHIFLFQNLVVWHVWKRSHISHLSLEPAFVTRFNGWQNSTPLTNEGFGRWKVDLPDKVHCKHLVILSSN